MSFEIPGVKPSYDCYVEHERSLGETMTMYFHLKDLSLESEDENKVPGIQIGCSLVLLFLQLAL